MSVWAISSGLPMILFALTAMFSDLRNMTQRQLEIAILIAAPSAAVVGFILMWVSAWLTATPVRSVRDALKQVEEGDLDTHPVVFDGNRTRRTSAGFNSMVEGLREQGTVRDLFSRHVGRDVAAAAEQHRPTLGGEERHVAVLFIDIVGSTRMATSRPPIEVVELLNRFFAVIVEEVDQPPRHGEQVRGRRSARGVRRARRASSVRGRRAGSDPRDRPPAPSEVPECLARIEWPPGWWPETSAPRAFRVHGDREPVNEAARLAELARSEPKAGHWPRRPQWRRPPNGSNGSGAWASR